MTDTFTPWHPISDPVDLKYLGKLAEEGGELTQATCRCIIQGMDEVHPVTGKANKKWLEEEIADVICNATLIINRFGLNHEKISKRIDMKTKLLKIWHEGA